MNRKEIRMIFITKNNKEIQVPSDYTFQSLDKFAQDVYQQGILDTIDEFLKCIALKRKYAEKSIDDYLNYVEVSNWLMYKKEEQLKGE